ncbi:MAG: aminoacyl-tRNA hydrolase [Oscillospiraceae bacterium]|mgnify:CR=1 FL=1|nr:aminoacyl-tRNA hydrolase [Oscillospiraceae bacterium]MDD4367348.1 aminoacyl-tRNA hydrolase [Oscillospiraceae bacterium]
MLCQTQPERATGNSGQLYLIAGLGNPGSRYAATFHNCGFMALDRLAQLFAVKVNKARFKGVYGRGTACGRQVILLKPETFMNNSGQSLSAAVAYFKVPLDQVLLLYDDVDIPLGQIRIREKGGPGTHNGMRSVVSALASQQFPRIRIGIGPQPAAMDIADYVLSRVSPAQQLLLDQALQQVAEAVPLWLEHDIQLAMNRVNPSRPHHKEAQQPDA